ncbi:MAG: hypothetical protein ACRD1R_16850 [Acidobacteriota bacterium]
MTHRLYNMKEDPQEKKNLASDPDYRQILRQLQLTMLKRFQQTHPAADQLPEDLSIEGQLAWFCEPPESIR